MLRAALRSRRAVHQLVARYQESVSCSSSDVTPALAFQVRPELLRCDGPQFTEHQVYCLQAQNTFAYARGFAKQPPNSEIPRDSVRKP